MNRLTFIKYCIVDGLKVCFPQTTLGIPKRLEEIGEAYDMKATNFKLPSNNGNNGLYSKHKHFGR